MRCCDSRMVQDPARQQMLVTRIVIVFARVVVDITNYFIYLFQKPFRKAIGAWTQDSTLFYVIYGTFLGLYMPYLVYPYLQELIDPDMRQKKEEERVRVNLQKGDDPLPHVRDKDNLRGAERPLYVTDDTAVKLSVDGDWRSMERFRAGREEELRAQQRRADAWIRLEEEHREKQFGFQKQMDRVIHIDQPRRGVPTIPWSPQDRKPETS